MFQNKKSHFNPGMLFSAKIKLLNCIFFILNIFIFLLYNKTLADYFVSFSSSAMSHFPAQKYF